MHVERLGGMRIFPKIKEGFVDLKVLSEDVVLAFNFVDVFDITIFQDTKIQESAAFLADPRGNDPGALRGIVPRRPGHARSP